MVRNLHETTYNDDCVSYLFLIYIANNISTTSFDGILML